MHEDFFDVKLKNTFEEFENEVCPLNLVLKYTNEHTNKYSIIISSIELNEINNTHVVNKVIDYLYEHMPREVLRRSLRKITQIIIAHTEDEIIKELLSNDNLSNDDLLYLLGDGIDVNSVRFLIKNKIESKRINKCEYS